MTDGSVLAAAAVVGDQREAVQVHDRIDINRDIRRGITNYGTITTPTVSPTGHGKKEVTQAPADRVSGDPPVPVPPGTVLELDNNPLYHCLRAQMNNRNSQCCGALNTLYAHTFQFPRVTHSALSPTLERAYLAGWAMVNTVMFPLVRNHTLRCVWALVQFVLLGIGLPSVLSGCGYFYTSLTFNIVAIIIAFIDTVVFFTITSCQRYVGEETRQLLLGHHHIGIAGRWGRLKRGYAFVNKYNDLVRLAYAEVFLFIITATELLPLVTGDHVTINGFPCQFYWAGMSPILVAYLLLVYLAQIVAILQMLLLIRKTRHRTPAWRMAGWLTLQLLLHYMVHRVAQAAIFIIYIRFVDSLTISEHNTYAFVCIVASAYLTPVLGTAAFPILRHGWIQDFCIVWCTDYLSQLEEVRRNPQTPQDTRDTIQELLQWFDYQSLIGESRSMTETRMWNNLLYTIQRPFILFMCIPYMGCMIILVFGVLFSHVPYFSSPVPYVVTGIILISNGQLVLIVANWIVMFIPYLFALLYHLCSNYTPIPS